MISIVIYADVLVILNLYINFFLIRTAALLMRRDISVKRSVLGAAIGAFAALIILLPPLPSVIVFLEKILLCAVITYISFGRQSIPDFMVSSLYFLTVNFIFAGVMLALWTFAAPYGMFLSNGVCTFNIPLGAVIVFTIAAYCSVRLVRSFSDKRAVTSRIVSVRIFYGGNEAELRGLCDTGCLIRDLFSGKPIIVCEINKLSEIIPDEIRAYLRGDISAEQGIRLVPYKTASSQTLMPIFRASRTEINGKAVDVYIGVTNYTLGEDIDCVFDPNILSV